MRPLLRLVSRTGIPPASLIRRCHSTWLGVEALCVCWMWVQGCRVPRGARQAFLLMLGRTPLPPAKSSQPEVCLLAHLHPLPHRPPNCIRFFLTVFAQGSPSAWRSSFYCPFVYPLDTSTHIPMPISLPASEPGAPLDLPPSLSKHHWTPATCQHCSSSRVSGGHNGTNTRACDPCVVSAVGEGQGGSGWSGGPL